jgi:nucleotide-binding universal stress UspA family protein
MAGKPLRRRLTHLLRPAYLVVVPLLDRKATRHALDVACRLASDRRSSVLLVAPLFVELELPLDALFEQEEAELRAELDVARKIAESYGVGCEATIVRTRHGQLGADLAAAAVEASASLVVVGAPIESRRAFRRPFSRDVWSVIQDAPCPVLIATESAKGARAA